MTRFDLQQQTDSCYNDLLTNKRPVIGITANYGEQNAKLGEYYIPMSKESVDKYCKDYNITPNNLFLSATLLTLSKYTYTKDMLIATISSGRLNPNYENIHRISGYNLIKLNANKLNLMKAAGLRIDDARYLPAYEAYCNMRRMSIPRKRMYDFIREEFGVSRTTMQEVAARFERTIDNASGDYGDP